MDQTTAEFVIKEYYMGDLGSVAGKNCKMPAYYDQSTRHDILDATLKLPSHALRHLFFAAKTRQLQCNILALMRTEQVDNDIWRKVINDDDPEVCNVLLSNHAEIFYDRPLDPNYNMAVLLCARGGLGDKRGYVWRRKVQEKRWSGGLWWMFLGAIIWGVFDSVLKWVLRFQLTGQW